MKCWTFALTLLSRLTMKRSMIAMLLMAAILPIGDGGQAQAATTIDFDEFPATPTGTLYDEPDFLADYGISNITIGGATGARGPLIIDTTPYFGFIEPSPPNIFRQDNALLDYNQPHFLEFEFYPELISFSLTRIGFDSGRSMPRWQANFYDSAGSLLGSFGEPYLCCNYPPKVFSFSDPLERIAKMRLTSWHTASTFRNIGVDDFVLTLPDSDGDGFDDDLDNCPVIANHSQSDIDGDLAGDLCDICPADADDGCVAEGSAAEEILADEGGIVETPDGQLAIEIDPGDLLEDTTISITQATDSDPEVDLIFGTNSGKGQAIALYDFEPDGLVFNSDVTLSVVLDVSGLNANQRGKLDIYRFEDTNANGVPDTYVALGAICDVVEGPPETFIATCIVGVDHFSTFGIVVPLDLDDDGVPDEFDGRTDMCPDTVIPEGAPTSGSLRYNRWALMDEDGVFDTRRSRGGGTSASFTIEDTAGCSCEQIVVELGLGANHLKKGCSTSSMLQWVEMMSSP